MTLSFTHTPWFIRHIKILYICYEIRSWASILGLGRRFLPIVSLFYEIGLGGTNTTNQTSGGRTNIGKNQQNKKQSPPHTNYTVMIGWYSYLKMDINLTAKRGKADNSFKTSFTVVKHCRKKKKRQWEWIQNAWISARMHPKCILRLTITFN